MKDEEERKDMNMKEKFMKENKSIENCECDVMDCR